MDRAGRLSPSAPQDWAYPRTCAILRVFAQDCNIKMLERAHHDNNECTISSSNQEIAQAVDAHCTVCLCLIIVLHHSRWSSRDPLPARVMQHSTLIDPATYRSATESLLCRSSGHTGAKNRVKGTNAHDFR